MPADDHYSAVHDSVLEVDDPGVLANDRGVNSVAMAPLIVTSTSHGVVTLGDAGGLTYEPEAGYIGSVEFTYCISLRAAPLLCASRAAKVTIDVTAISVVDDSFSTPVGVVLDVPAPGVFGNDAGVGPGMAAVFGTPGHGTVVVSAVGGGFRYTPAAGFRGKDVFFYCAVASLGSSGCVSGEATVTVAVGRSVLVPADDVYTVRSGGVLTRSAGDGLFVNDSGVLASDLVFVATPPAFGALTGVGAGGAFTYTPRAGYVGPDSFGYCIALSTDPGACYTATAIVRIDVQDAAHDPSTVVRVGGADRFAVSAAVSARTFAKGVPVAYVASGAVFADALSGSAAAGAKGGPVLLTTRDALPGVVAAELRRLEPRSIVILGGENSVSAVVRDELAALAPSVTRFGGADRYAVSALISQKSFDPDARVAYVASGENFPDALSGSAAAGHLGGPVLLVGRDGVSAAVSAELQRLAPRRIVVLGGVNSVSDAVVAALGAVAPTTRTGGADRFVVSAAASAEVFPAHSRTVYVASGAVFPDALSGSAAAIRQQAPVLLVTATDIPSTVAAELHRLEPTTIVVLGGPNTVSDAVETQLKTFLAP